jgi:steroid delta-isomerase-like uncharacterized protein
MKSIDRNCAFRKTRRRKLSRINYFFPLALLLCLTAGCRHKAAQTELEEFKVKAEIEEQNKTLVKRYVEAINEGDFEAFRQFLSHDYAIYSPSGYPEPTSQEALIDNYKGAREAFSEFTWSIEDMIAAEDKVVCRISIRGSSKAGVPGLPKNETKFEFSLIAIMRIEDGKVVEEWQEDDQLGLARQLGMELKPKEVEQ